VSLTTPKACALFSGMNTKAGADVCNEFSLGSLGLPDISRVLEKGFVPEHSARFMRAMSCGEPFIVQGHLFLAGQDWLMAVGYPLDAPYDPDRFAKALRESVRRVRPDRCWAVCPFLPADLAGCRVEQDFYYTLPVESRVKPRLVHLAQRASRTLRVEQGREFTSAHHQLWQEFINNRTLPSRVRTMYQRTGHVLAGVQELFFLNAWDKSGHLAACLFLDPGPRRFMSYLIGAHSRINYTPYATDLLFREMVELARDRGKEFVHLGLGVNPGIRRFKVKWGGTAHWPFEFAAWEERPQAQKESRVHPVPFVEDKFKFFLNLPEQRRLAMLWELEKNGRRSWIAGAAHFYPFSFRLDMRNLFQEVDTVLCEGPLDQVSMELIADFGKNPDPDTPRLASMLTDKEIKDLEKVVLGRGLWNFFFNVSMDDSPDVRYYLAHTRPWLAFFTMWSSFLRRHGWEQSVDREAWNTAQEMGKYVLGMETISEQLRTLESIPVDRIVRFLRDCRNWSGLKKRYETGYLKGDLDRMFGSSAEFPSRTEMVINRRDERFLKRMLPFLEQGRCAVFVGSAHMLNLRGMLRQAGFSVRRRK